jgi:CDP-diacylglycerol--glycerol-3-phosphate 3-phosphatidyltransferase
MVEWQKDWRPDTSRFCQPARIASQRNQIVAGQAHFHLFVDRSAPPALCQGDARFPTPMNLPNKLTLSRLVLTALFVVCLHMPPEACPFSVALVIFAAASITDYLDGHIARARGLITNFGKLFDPLADKILITAAFIMLVEEGLLPAWVAIVILSREFFVTGIRQIAASQSVVLAAENLGKHKMAWQIITVLYFMLHAASRESCCGWLAPLFGEDGDGHPTVESFIIYFTTLLTVVSGFSYFWKNRALFSDL